MSLFLVDCFGLNLLAILAIAYIADNLLIDFGLTVWVCGI